MIALLALGLEGLEVQVNKSCTPLDIRQEIYYTVHRWKSYEQVIWLVDWSKNGFDWSIFF